MVKRRSWHGAALASVPYDNSHVDGVESDHDERLQQREAGQTHDSGKYK